MKKKFTVCIIFLLASFYSLYATAPTVPASNLQFPATNIDGNRFTITFNKGNGSFRIIVLKAGSAVNTLPVNGADYTANAAYGTAGTQFAAGDGYVVYKGSSTVASQSQIITNLQPGTVYYVSIFEFNGSGAATEYLTIGLSGNASTKTAPATQAAITSYTNVIGNKLTINWSNGNGDKRLLIARKGAPVNALPGDLQDYSQSTVFGSGNVINGDNYVIYKGTATSTVISNLEPNTTYYFAIFEYNGNLGPVYMTPGATSDKTTNAGPTQASGTIFFNNIEGSRITTSFASGNGKYQLIIARQSQPVTAVPVNGQTYSANTSFGSGNEIAPGQFVVNSLNTDKTFTNLLPNTIYHFRVYDFDMDANGNTYYLTSAYSQNSSSTAIAPTTQASNVRFENITGSSVTIKHDPGNGAYRLIVMKQGSAVDATPADLTKYNGNTIFGTGNQVTPGNYVITGGQNGTNITATGLTPGITYHVAVFGFNGNNYPVYAVPAATASITIPNEPASAGTGFSTNSEQGNSFRVQWNGGDGSRRIVIARKNAAVTALPVDGTTYTASAVFGNGTAIETGQFVVYDDVNRLVDMQNLEPGTVYHFAVFEYNSSASGPDYLVSSFLAGSASTISAPSLQASALSASNIQNAQATINFSTGNGSSRIFMMRAGSPVNADPQDLVNYGFSPTYGVNEIGTGNYIVQKTSGSNSFVVSSLSPATQYYVSVFEYNGSTAPIYLIPGASFSFTTTGSAVTPPFVNATAPSFSLVDGNKLTFNWANGNGAKRIVVMRQNNAIEFTPVNGNDYTANAAFGNGTDLGGGQYVVLNGTQGNVTVTNLLPSTIYHFAVFEYNGTGATASYLAAGSLNSNHSTAITPTSGSTNPGAIISGLTMNITWSNGVGAARMIVMKEGNAVSGSPADLSKYPANAIFKSGSQIAAGEYVVYAGSGNNVAVTGLQSNKTYHYKIFEYNGVDAPIYNTADAISGSATISASLPVKWLYFTARKNNENVLLEWGTAEEMNASHFIVERSINNGDFTAIANIIAKGTHTRNDYSFTDNSKPAGTIYYRIKQVDIDNKFEYSIQVKVQANEKAANLKLYPNPAFSFVRISLPGNMQQASMKIYSIEGKLVKTNTITNGEMVQLDGMPSGFYQVVIHDNDKQYSERLIVR